MKSSGGKRFIFPVVIVCLLLLFVPMIFSSISDAQIQPEKNVPQEDQVKIYGEDKITITANDSFHPNQYYKAVGDDYQPVQLNYTNINTTKPGRYALILTAKNKEDYDKRTVLVIVEKEKPAPAAKVESKTQTSQNPTPSSSEETIPEPVESSVTQTPVEPSSSAEAPQPTSESTQEVAPQQEPVVAAQEVPPAPQHTPEAPEPEPVSQATTYTPNQISFNGISIPYQNAGQGSGQGIINGGAVAATWGGSSIQSGTDGLNTHFIGHNPGIFSPICSLGAGSSITVTDSAGDATTYIVNGLIQVDDSGRDIHSGQDHWDQITSTGGGERITLQTCLSDTVNLIVYAQA